MRCKLVEQNLITWWLVRCLFFLRYHWLSLSPFITLTSFFIIIFLWLYNRSWFFLLFFGIWWRWIKFWVFLGPPCGTKDTEYIVEGSIRIIVMLVIFSNSLSIYHILLVREIKMIQDVILFGVILFQILVLIFLLITVMTTSFF